MQLYRGRAGLSQQASSARSVAPRLVVPRASQARVSRRQDGVARRQTLLLLGSNMLALSSSPNIANAALVEEMMQEKEQQQPQQPAQTEQPAQPAEGASPEGEPGTPENPPTFLTTTGRVVASKESFEDGFWAASGCRWWVGVPGRDWAWGLQTRVQTHPVKQVSEKEFWVLAILV